MSDLLRQEIATLSHSIVVKVGTRVVTHPNGTLNETRIAQLAEELCQLADRGKDIVLVSSGAVGAGMNRLKLSSRPTDLADLQAVAAVGQTRLIEAYDRVFREHGRYAAQVLLTAKDLNDRVAYLNVRNTLHSLMEFGAIPIINENDTVAVDELMTTFGDNDRLAALVTNLIAAPLLVLLSDVGGLLDGPPESRESQVIDTVTAIDEEIRELVVDRATGHSKGGMSSKLEAARIVTAAGENMIIASGHEPHNVIRIADGKTVGTLFLAQGKAVSPRKRWLAYSAQPCGQIHVDVGARRALEEQGKSLLSIGIVKVVGNFRKGDVVSLLSTDGDEFARGLSNYNATDAKRIRGLQSHEIAAELGHRPYEEVIHRNNLSLLRS